MLNLSHDDNEMSAATEIVPKIERTSVESGPSASTGEHCICIVSDLLWLGLIWSCFVFCLLFLLFYVICAPVLTEGTVESGEN